MSTSWIQKFIPGDSPMILHVRRRRRRRRRWKRFPSPSRPKIQNQISHKQTRILKWLSPAQLDSFRLLGHGLRFSLWAARLCSHDLHQDLLPKSLCVACHHGNLSWFSHPTNSSRRVLLSYRRIRLLLCTLSPSTIIRNVEVPGAVLITVLTPSSSSSRDSLFCSILKAQILLTSSHGSGSIAEDFTTLLSAPPRASLNRHCANFNTLTTHKQECDQCTTSRAPRWYLQNTNPESHLN